MNARPLTVHQAEIHTAAVEIKTLTIKGKQVTLAVFRQMVEESLVTPGGQLNGVPWGCVNYHDRNCPGHAEHRHVVWQLGTELRRAVVRLPQYPRPGTPLGIYVEPASAFIQALYCQREHDPSIYDPSRLRGHVIVRTERDFYIQGSSPNSSGYQHDRSECPPSADDVTALYRDLCDIAREELEAQRGQWAAWEGVLTLPQLFIAV